MFIGDMIKNIKEKAGVIMKAVDEKDVENRLKIIIGGTEFLMCSIVTLHVT